MRLIKLLAATMAMSLPSAAAGYEIETHGQLSEAALEQIDAGQDSRQARP